MTTPVVCAAPDACSDGYCDPATGACRVRPRAACRDCGNGQLNAGEECDDGERMPGDGCRADCTIERHGDGIVDPDEECDDGNLVDGDGCDSNGRHTRCGNSVMTAGEQCDDGNDAAGDGCSGTCRTECTADESCDDADPCTRDHCTDGSCLNDELPGFEGAICEVGELVRVPLCGSDTLPLSYRRMVVKRVRNVQGSLRKAAQSPKRNRMARLVVGADKRLGGIEKRALSLMKKRTVSRECAATIGRLVSERREMVRRLRP
jgi:cysteine-rich repeat protein